MRLADKSHSLLVQSIFANIPFLELRQSKTGLAGRPGNRNIRRAFSLNDLERKASLLANLLRTAGDLAGGGTGRPLYGDDDWPNSWAALRSKSFKEKARRISGFQATRRDLSSIGATPKMEY